MEILHKDKIAEILAHTPYQEDHAPLMKALRFAYPGWEFVLAGIQGEYRAAGQKLLTAEGDVIADDFESWVRAKYEAMGQDVRSVWENHKDAGMVLAERRRTRLVVVGPYGPEPDAFMQMDVDVKHETTGRYAFENNSWSTPDCLRDLLQPMTDLAPERELSPRTYELSAVTDIRRFVRDMVDIYRVERQAMLPEVEKKMVHCLDIDVPQQRRPRSVPFLDIHPDWAEWEHPCTRLFRDWQESSAGQFGYRFCDHWFFSMNDYTDNDGKRHMSVIPRWADADRVRDLPTIRLDEEDSSIDAFNMLCDFDDRAGYKFAWYFFMLHGNKINAGAALAVVRGVQNCSIWLPERDERVLMRWHQRIYGF